MGRKIFVSYKHNDNNVAPINSLNTYAQTTARTYVDYLMERFQGEEIYKGEGNEDLSQFKDDTIKTRLKDKIHDSSITIVLISPNMKNLYKPEKDQWIPWEISYSLKEIVRNDKTSHTNAILAVVLPDKNSNYSYYINKCNNTYGCITRKLETNILFKLLKDNIFNAKEATVSKCTHCGFLYLF